MNVGERVPVEQHQVGNLPYLDGPATLFLSHETCGSDCRSLQGRHGRQARLHQQRKFVVKAEAWKYIRIVDVAAREDGNTSPVHAPDELELFRKLAVSVSPNRSGPCLH